MLDNWLESKWAPIILAGLVGACVFYMLIPSATEEEQFPYGPGIEIGDAPKRYHAKSPDDLILPPGMSWHDPNVEEVAIHIGEGWDYLVTWDLPDGRRGALNYDGTIDFLNPDGSNTLRGLQIEELR